MKFGKSITSSLLISVLAFVGSFAIVTPTCLGWFYEPKKPVGLMGELVLNNPHHKRH